MEAVVSTTKIQQATPESDNRQEEADTSHPVSLKCKSIVIYRILVLLYEISGNIKMCKKIYPASKSVHWACGV